MKCKHCGLKLGIMERWRFGDFCSEEHKGNYSHDLVRLNEQIVRDLSRMPSRLRGEAKTAKPDRAEQPAPAVAAVPAVEGSSPIEPGFVMFVETPPVRLAGPSAKCADGPPVPKSKSDQWRMFARMADWEGLPASVLATSRMKQSRFVWIHHSETSVPGPGGSLLGPEYPAFLPYPQLRRCQGRMPMAQSHHVGRAVDSPHAIAGVAKQWVDDEGWRWIPEKVPAQVPEFAPILSEYPISAPWTDWTITTRAGAGAPVPAAPMSRPAAPSAPRPAAAQPAMPHASFPQQTSAMPVGVQPAAAPAPYACASQPPMGMMMWPAIPGPAAGPGWSGSAAWFAGQPGAVPYLVAPPQAAPMAAPPAPWSSGLAWREIPPPIFNALVDPSQSLKPLTAPPPMRLLEAEPIPGTPLVAGCSPSCPALKVHGMAILDCQGDPSEDVESVDSPRTVHGTHARTLWRHRTALPRGCWQMRQPTVPRRPPPPMILQMRQPPLPPKASPVLFSGRWSD